MEGQQRKPLKCSPFSTINMVLLYQKSALVLVATLCVEKGIRPGFLTTNIEHEHKVWKMIWLILFFQTLQSWLHLGLSNGEYEKIETKMQLSESGK